MRGAFGWARAQRGSLTCGQNTREELIKYLETHLYDSDLLRVGAWQLQG